MAKRYVRTLMMDRLGDDLQAAESAASGLARVLKDRASAAFPAANGWKRRASENEGNEILGMGVENETFEGELLMVTGSDLQQADQGMVRKTTLRISAQCTNKNRRNAREFQLGMEQKTGNIFGGIGGVGLAVLLSLGEIIFLQRIHVIIPLGGFIIGYGIGYAIGHMSGGAVGGAIGKGMAKNERHEERSFENAMQDWEAFLEDLMTDVDDLAVQVETTPSTPTVT